MRQLWLTGWMHNRVRMIAASLLIKHLGIHWTQGEKWFWDTLVDADLANNAANWQWVAGSGADAAPFFRIFNPVLQGEKFDPSGDYVRTLCARTGTATGCSIVHKPWKAPQPPANYPLPIVDLNAGPGTRAQGIQSDCQGLKRPARTISFPAMVLPRCHRGDRQHAADPPQARVGNDRLRNPGQGGIPQSRPVGQGPRRRCSSSRTPSAQGTSGPAAPSSKAPPAIPASGWRWWPMRWASRP